MLFYIKQCRSFRRPQKHLLLYLSTYSHTVVVNIVKAVVQQEKNTGSLDLPGAMMDEEMLGGRQ